MELWDDDKKLLLCRSAPVYGNGTAAMNENGFMLAHPPCLWGNAAEGLLPPPLIHLDSNLSCVKQSNSTNGHWGEMALWQMRAAYL